jgi:hypothetical protein
MTVTHISRGYVQVCFIAVLLYGFSCVGAGQGY